jgi:tetratricopeptide (TPR) repeat protein
LNPNKEGDKNNMRTFLRVVVLLFLIPIWSTGCQSVFRRNQVERFDDYYERGLQAKREGKREEAIRYFQAALQKNPGSPRAHFHIAVLYADQDQDLMAIAGFNRALMLEPNFQEAYYNLGTLYLRQRDYRKSIEMLEQAVFLNPEDSAAFINLGKAYFILGMAELAGAAYEEALRIDPANPRALHNLGLLKTKGNLLESEAISRETSEEKK